MIFLFYFFYDLAYTPLLVSYSLEILPFRVRAKGFAVMVSSPLSLTRSPLNRFQNITIMATVAFNTFVNPWALEDIGWWYYLVYCGWLIIELGFVLAFVVETKGRTLEETSALFDGEEQSYDLLTKGGDAANHEIRTRTGREDDDFPVRRIPTLSAFYRPPSDGQVYEMEKRYSGSTNSTHRKEFMAI
jgi:Sugar (and other) transporter